MVQLHRQHPLGGSPQGRPPLRIARMVVLLLVVVCLMNMARRPQSWSWLWQVTQPTGVAAKAAPSPADEIDTRVRKALEQPTDDGVFISVAHDDPPAPAAAEGFFPGVDPQWFQAVKDDTAVRTVEHAALAHLIELLHTTAADQLNQAARTDVTYAQLYQQPPAYRGQLVQLAGQVRRADWIRAPRNDAGIERLAELWLQPEGAPANPLAVYCLELPPGFPQGVQLTEPVVVSGFFFKRWLYNARDTLRTTPLVVGKTVTWRREPPASPTPVTGWEIARVLVIGAVCGLAAAVYLFRSAGRRKRARSVGALLVMAATVFGSRDAQAAAAPEVPAQEMFELLGLSEDDWRAVRDPAALAAQPQALGKFLYVARRVTPVYWSRWSKLPQAAGGVDVRHWQGRLHASRYVECSQEETAKFGLPGYYEIQCALDDGQTARVFSLEAPPSWKDPAQAAVGDRIGTIAVTLHAAADPPVLVLASIRVAWYPDTPLGNLGVDAGPLDAVIDRTRLSHDDIEAFYSTLAAAGRLADEALTPASGSTTAVAPLFNEPAKQRGKQVVIEGNARRAVKINLTDEALVERFGLDHYFELEVFTDDSQGSPLVACVRQLPADFPLGDAIYERVRVGGFFFKVWAYELNFPGEQPPAVKPVKKRYQLAPLILGKSVRRLPRPAVVTATGSGAISAALFAAALAAGVVWLWLQQRDDRQHAARRRAAAVPSDPVFLAQLEPPQRDVEAPQ